MKLIRNGLIASFLTVGFALCFQPSPAAAAMANVLVGSGGNFFVPAVTNIHVGDRVLWTWAGSPHNVTSTNSAWAMSPTQSTGATFTNTFGAAGTYFYYCTIHGTPTSGMKGAIVVAAVSTPPTVTITNPATGSVFAAPANVTIQASASDSSGTVTNVEFLVDTTVVGNVVTVPFSAVASSLGAGGHTLSAIAANNTGLTATNSVSISVVNPTPIVLSAPTQSGSDFQFSFSADAGLQYVIQRSTDLTANNWTSLTTNLAGSSSMTFTDANPTVNPAYYRVGLLPNP